MPPPLVRIARLTAHPDTNQEMWVRSGADRAIPARFTATAVLDEPPCVVSLKVVVDFETMASVVRQVVVLRAGEGALTLAIGLEDRRPFGPPINASLLHRVALDTLLRHALDAVAEPIVPAEREGWTGLFMLKRDVTPDGAARMYGGRRTSPITGRGRRTPDEVLRRVADTYRAAVAAGRPPTAAVAEGQDVSRSHAGRLVMQARRAGHLGPTIPGKAGERRAEPGLIGETVSATGPVEVADSTQNEAGEG